VLPMAVAVAVTRPPTAAPLPRLLRRFKAHPA
jgi:hypothetical protein